MTDKKISDLAAATALAGTDFVEIDTGTASRKIAASFIGDYVEARPSLAELIRDTIGSALVAGSNIIITPSDAGDSITISASGSGSSAPDRHPGYVAGRWYRPFPAATSGSVSPTANQLTALPFVLTKDVTISDLGIRLTTGQSSSHIVLAIYSNNSATHMPDTLLGQTSALSSTSSGVNLSETLATPIVLTAGVYWMAILTDNSSLSVSGMSTTEAQLAWLLGIPSGGNISSPPLSVTAVLTYTATLPSTFTAGATLSTSVNLPLVLFKVS